MICPTCQAADVVPVPFEPVPSEDMVGPVRCQCPNCGSFVTDEAQPDAGP